MLKDILTGHGKDNRMWVVAEAPNYTWIVGHTYCNTVIDKRIFKIRINALLWFIKNVDEVSPIFEEHLKFFKGKGG